MEPSSGKNFPDARLPTELRESSEIPLAASRADAHACTRRVINYNCLSKRDPQKYIEPDARLPTPLLKLTSRLTH